MNPPDRAADAEALQQALALLDAFARRLLGGTLRRVLAWKRLPSFALHDVLDDVRQELALDCLQNARTIVGLDRHDRHLRWMRIAERFVYRARVQADRERPIVRDAPVPCESGMDLRDLPWLDANDLSNGRRNITATARRYGMQPRELREAIHRHATAAGHDASYHEFWRARAAEALTGRSEEHTG